MGMWSVPESLKSTVDGELWADNTNGRTRAHAAHYKDELDRATGDKEQFLRYGVSRKEACTERHVYLSYQVKVLCTLVFAPHRTARDVFIWKCTRNRICTANGGWRYGNMSDRFGRHEYEEHANGSSGTHQKRTNHSKPEVSIHLHPSHPIPTDACIQKMLIFVMHRSRII